MDYKEKLKTIINSDKTPFIDIKTFLKYFPELKESEDERIRKELIFYLRYQHSISENFEDIGKWIAWLEKQGEHDMGISEVTKQELKDNLNKALAVETGESWNEFLDEQKSAWSEEDERIYQSIMDDTVQENQLNDKQTNWLKGIKYRYFPQPKQEWSEEDEKKRNTLIGYIVSKNELGLEYADWLKSLRPQTYNISEEELAQAKKDAYNDALDKIEYHSGEPTFDDGWSAAIWYLKKRNAQPQNTWKPSEEQMQVLHWCMPLWVEPKSKAILESLINDLKKLREE